MSTYFIIVLLVVFLQISFFCFYGYARHSNYLTSIFDLGVFDQAIWGILNDSPFLDTIIFGNKANWLSVHFSLILIFFVPFYAIHLTAYWLVFAQAVALPLAAIPLFYVAKRIFNSESVACLWAIVYMCNPYILNAASWDFHVVTLTVPLVALAYYSLVYKNLKLLLATCFLILLCKEHFGLLVVGFGLLWAIKYREVKPALLLVLLGGACFALVVGVLMPTLNPNGELLMMSTGKGHLSRYNWLGRSAGEVFLRILTDPISVIGTIFVTMQGWKYIFGLAVPFLCLCFWKSGYYYLASQI